MSEVAIEGSNPQDPEQPGKIGLPRIALALSGGGKRASLFSLGALTAFVTSGINGNVASIASVSGGSITNALIGLNTDFSAVTEDSFNAISSKAFTSLWKRRLRISVLQLALPLAIGTWLAFWSPIGHPLTHALDTRYAKFQSDLGLSPPKNFRSFNTINFFAGFFGYLGLRTVLQVVSFHQLFSKTSSRGRRPGKLDELSKRLTQHAFCMTDLEDASPLVFVDNMAINRFGVFTTDGSLSVAEVVTASSAFPFAFFPAFVDVKTTEGTIEKRRFVVTDGGVFNNLGTDWPMQGTFLSAFWALNERAWDAVVVVDASASPPLVKARGLLSRSGPVAEIGWIGRILRLLYASTIEPRQQALQALAISEFDNPSVVITSLLRSVPEYAEHLAKLPDPIGLRAQELSPQLLELRSTEEWAAMRDSAQGLGTTLGRVKQSTARNVVLHGYYLMLVALHCQFGIKVRLWDPQYLTGAAPFRRGRPWPFNLLDRLCNKVPPASRTS